MDSRYGSEEIAALTDAMGKRSLWPYGLGPGGFGHPLGCALELVKATYAPAADKVFVVPTSSGTASIHVALAGLQIPAGSEVIVPPITDAGTVMPIIAQNAIPVFADVDRDSGLLTAATIGAAITDATSAVIVVHLTGSPADVGPIVKLCRERERPIRIIEDVAQAQGARVSGTPVGLAGDAGCFSLNTWKHVTTGEGGFVLVKTEDDFHRCLNYADKHRNRMGAPETGENGTYAGTGINYRISQLQGAMLLAQWPKLRGIAEKRNAFGMALDQELKAFARITPQRHVADAFPTFFGYMFRVETVKPDGSDPRKKAAIETVNDKLKAANFTANVLHGAYSEPWYRYRVFKQKTFFDAPPGPDGKPIWPAELVAQQTRRNAAYDYTNVKCEVAEEYVARSFWLDCDESNTVADATVIAGIIDDGLRAAGL